MHKRINMLREFSIPLISGIVLALVWSNLFPDSFTHFNHDPLIGPLSFQFLTNNIFMVLFFGIAAAEITQSCLPGGDLHPLRKAINPILATIGGVVGPVLVYLGLNAIIGDPSLARVWGIIAAMLGISWSVISYLAISLNVVEKINPHFSSEHCQEMMRRTWGEQVICNFSFGLKGAMREM